MPIWQGWTDDLATGMEAIDSRHRELFRRIDDLLDAMRYGYSADELRKTISFLGEYASEHFREEERLMVESRYLGVATHKAMHDAFVEKFADLSDKIEDRGASKALAVEAQRLIGSSLKADIEEHDRKLAAHILRAPANPDGLKSRR